MTTHTTYDNGQVVAAGSGTNAAGSPMPTCIMGEFDASRRNCVAGDVVELLNIPANTFVKRVFWKVKTVEGAGIAMNIGDGTDPNGYVDAADVTGLNDGLTVLALTEGTPNVVTAYSGGKFYTAADTIDLEVPAGDAWDTLKVVVIAECVLFG